MGNVFALVRSEQVAVTAAAASATVATTTGMYRVASNRAIHIKVGGNATASDYYLPVGCEAVVSVGTGEAVSVIRSVGETDGQAWVTEVRHA